MGKYQELVKRAKEIMNFIECHQAEIAKLALEACEISRGGNFKDHRYTLKDFAEDTGIPYGAIKNWVGTYQHVLAKIDIKNPTKEQWSAGAKTFASLRTLNNEEGVKGRTFKETLPRERVEDLYSKISGNPEDSIAAHQALKYALMIQSSLKKIDLSTQNASLLSQIANTLIPVTTKITNHLTSKKASA